MTSNLWPEFDVSTQSKTVRAILKEHGSGISAKTKDNIRFSVQTSFDDDGSSRHHCTLYVQSIGYHYPFMTVTHGREMYPVTIHSDASPTPVVSANEGELVKSLSFVFNADSTKKAVAQLLDALSDAR
jgi:hypothetical protein